MQLETVNWAQLMPMGSELDQDQNICLGVCAERL